MELVCEPQLQKVLAMTHGKDHESQGERRGKRGRDMEEEPRQSRRPILRLQATGIFGGRKQQHLNCKGLGPVGASSITSRPCLSVHLSLSLSLSVAREAKYTESHRVAIVSHRTRECHGHRGTTNQQDSWPKMEATQKGNSLETNENQLETKETS